MTLMVDAVMALVVLEALALLALRRRTILPNLTAGFLLLVAMRLALADAALAWVGLALLLGGIAHAIDLRSRLSLSAAGVPAGK